MERKESEKTNHMESNIMETMNEKTICISKDVNYSENIFEKHNDHDNKPKKDSIFVNQNLKFTSDIPNKKSHRPFNSEFVHISKKDFEITNYSLLKGRNKHSLENTFERSFMDKSDDWKGFKDTCDNLEVSCCNIFILIWKFLYPKLII